MATTMMPGEWSGPIGDVWAEQWPATDRSFAALDRALAAAILDRLPDRGTLVDIGCGAGRTSLDIAAARPAARIVGLDISPALVAVARDRAAERANLALAVGDAPALVADYAPVAGYYSRHGVMFFADPVAAFTALHAAAAGGAPLVFSCFRAPAENVWATETIGAVAGAGAGTDPHAPGPFAFAEADRVRAILDAAGWSGASAQAVDYAYRAGQGPDPVADAVDFFKRIGPTARALHDALETDRAATLARIAAACERYRIGDAIDFPAAAWIWTATA